MDRRRSIVLPFLVVMAGSCARVAGPSELADHPTVAAVEVSGPDRLLVHERALLSVTVRDPRGRIISAPSQPVFRSSDAGVVEVSDSGVVHGLRRGRATISVRVGDVTGTALVAVRARLAIRPGRPFANSRQDQWDAWPLGIGDTLRLSAVYLDIDGAYVAGVPQVSWRSNRPDVATVTSQGQVTGTAVGAANVTAADLEDTASTAVQVWDFGPAEYAATVRYAHAMQGVGPITLWTNRGGPVTLAFGQSVELPVAPGPFVVAAEGMPAGDSGYEGFKAAGATIRTGDHLDVYAVGGPAQGFLTRAWRTMDSIPADSSRVRLVQGWNDFGVVYLLSLGVAPSTLPELCYFDPADVSPYFSLPAGAFDLLLERKYGSQATVRLRTTAPAGGAVTMVLTGSSGSEMGVLTFPDR